MSEHTAENDAPRRGEFCERHFSWLCQAGQGKCQGEPLCACGSCPLSATLSERHDRGLHGRDRCIGSAITRPIPPGSDPAP